MSSGKTIDAVIPVYRPGPEFPQLLRMLQEQKAPLRRIILIITEPADSDETDIPAYDNIECIRIRPEEFDHGNTRNLGVSHSDADYVLLMTQDAVPEDENLTEELLAAFSDEMTASAYARQLPKPDCRRIEAFTRQFSYPAESSVKELSDLPRLGVRTYFCSNAAAMYDRKILTELGGFTKRTIFNEDMIYAYQVIQHGYRIAYCAGAKVLHSHNYSGGEQLRRNFDLAVSQADHPEIFAAVSSEKEGRSLVRKTAGHLLKTGRWYALPYLVYQSGMKYTGYFLGKRYRKLPEKLVRKLSMNQQYWEDYYGTDQSDTL